MSYLVRRHDGSKRRDICKHLVHIFFWHAVVFYCLLNQMRTLAHIKLTKDINVAALYEQISKYWPIVKKSRRKSGENQGDGEEAGENHQAGDENECGDDGLLGLVDDPYGEACLANALGMHVVHPVEPTADSQIPPDSMDLVLEAEGVPFLEPEYQGDSLEVPPTEIDTDTTSNQSKEVIEVADSQEVPSTTAQPPKFTTRVHDPVPSACTYSPEALTHLQERIRQLKPLRLAKVSLCIFLGLQKNWEIQFF